MPRVKIDYVVSFSSEDPENPANNLLGWEVSKKKWLCCRGEPSASVVLQLTKAVKISGVHIGVHHAALVEVLVGLSERPQQPFEVLVPRSVMLTPLESRREEAVCRVRSFSGAALAGAASGRWDRLRLVCSQPYNKRCKYGLSFVHIYESDGSDDMIPDAPSLTEATPTPVAAPPSVAARLLNLETNSSDDDDFKPGDLFRKQMLTNNAKNNTSTENQIRKATSQALRNIDDNSTKIVKTPISKTKVRQDPKLVDANHKDRQRDSLMYTDEDKPHDKIDKVVQQREKEKKDRDALDKNRNEKNQSSKQSNTVAKEQKCSFKELNFTNISPKIDKTPKSSKEDPQSNRKDPKSRRDHSQSSSKELEASREDPQSIKKDLKPREDPQPSRKEPSSRGEGESSTSRRSTQDDKDKRKRPHKADKGNKEKVPLDSILRGVQFALSGYVNPQRAELRDTAIALGARYSPDYTPSCTHLICAFPNTPKLKAVRAQSSHVVAVRGEWLHACRRKRRRVPWQPHATEPRHRTQETDSTSDGDSASDSECDTEDEIEKVRQQQKKRRTDEPPSPKAEQAKRSSDVKNVSSESDVAFIKDERFQGQVSVLSDSGDETAEEAVGVGDPVVSRELPDLFQGCTFAVDEKVVKDGFDPLLLARYIKAYGGELVQTEHIDNETGVDYYLCTRGPAPTLGLQVAPDWLWQCHELQTKCATDDYLL